MGTNQLACVASAVYVMCADLADRFALRPLSSTSPQRSSRRRPKPFPPVAMAHGCIFASPRPVLAQSV